MSHIDIKKQSCACCYSPDAKVECTLKLGIQTVPMCRDCLLDLYNQLKEFFQGCSETKTNCGAKMNN